MNQVINIQNMELSRKTVGKYIRLLYPSKNLKEKKRKHKVLVKVSMNHIHFSSKFPYIIIIVRIKKTSDNNSFH